MKNKINNWLFKLALKFIGKRLVWSENYLTPEYLLGLGWIEKDGYYFEPAIKDRDRISIQFEYHYYRIFHSEKMIFIALETKIEWFELYLLLVKHEIRFKLAGI